jgi:hypothetical protein
MNWRVVKSSYAKLLCISPAIYDGIETNAENSGFNNCLSY